MEITLWFKIFFFALSSMFLTLKLWARWAPDMKQTFWFSAGPRRRTKRLFAERAPFPAVLPESGRLLLGSPALPHSGLRLPASLLPTPLSAVFIAILSEPGLCLFPPVRPLPLHQLHPSAPASSVALAEVALRGRGATVTVSPGFEPGPPSGVSSCPTAAARSRGRGCSARRRSSRDAPGTSRPGWSSGDFFCFSACVALALLLEKSVRKSQSAHDKDARIFS